MHTASIGNICVSLLWALACNTGDYFAVGIVFSRGTVCFDFFNNMCGFVTMMVSLLYAFHHPNSKDDVIFL
jgi:hypothetical protein